MNQENAARILRGLKMSLNSRELTDGEEKLRQQQAAATAARPAERSNAGLRRACLNVVRALDSYDTDELPSLMNELRQQLGGEPSDEVSSHNQQYETHGSFTMFRPERKPSPKPW
jgi:hypothetical protein